MQSLRLILVGVLVGALQAAPLMAAVNISTPGSPSRELVIAGTADGKVATYKNTLWISADADVGSLAIVPTDFKGSSGQMIPVSNIHINLPITLQKNVPRELIVSVDTAFIQGDFKGTLMLSVPQDTSSQITPIPVTLHLSPKPSVTSAPTAFAFKLTSCETGITCRIADFLLPVELGSASRPWRVLNQTPATVDWTSGALILHGDKTGNFIDADVTTWSADIPPKPIPLAHPFTLPARQPTNVTFNFIRGTIKADHYQGQYRIELIGADPITIPFTLDVRDGPVLPLLVLVLGIVLGRLIQSANTPRAQAQLRLLDQYHSVSNMVDGVDYAAVKQSLQLRLNQIYVDVRRMSQSETEISSQLTLILRLAADSEKLDQVIPKIQEVTDAALKAKLLGLLSAARTFIMATDSVSTETTLASINSQLPVPPGIAAPSAAPMQVPPATTTPAELDGFAKFLAWLSGSEPLNGDRLYRYGRPLMFLCLLIFLAFVGLYNSYVKNATFGVEGYFDYLSLFLWGLSADVAQKTLQNLSFSRSS